MSATASAQAAPAGMLCATPALDAVRELAPLLRRATAEMEERERLSDDVLGALRDAGCLRLAVPAAYGGQDLSLPQVLAVLEDLSATHGTLGWMMGQVVLAQAVFAYLPETTVAELYADGPDVYAAGAAAAKGRATAVDGGWRVSGRWPLVSGSWHAAWVYLQCAVADATELPGGEGHIPQLRTMLLARDEVRIIETWHGLGLRGSASHDVHARAVLCPQARSCDLTGEPTFRTAMMRVPVAAQAGLVAAAVMTGIACGALDAIVALSAQKRPAFSTRRLAQSALMQDALGDAYTTLLSARWLLHGVVRDADGRATEGGPADEEHVTELRAVGPRVAELAWRAIDCAYALGGSSSVPAGSLLGRRLRDARSVSQHVTLGRGFYGRLGALRAGADASREL